MTRGVKHPLHFRMRERLKHARTSLGLTPHGLARLASVAPETVAGIEGGRRGSMLDTVVAIAAALGIEPGWLSYGLDGPGADTAGFAGRLRHRRTEAQMTAAALGKAAGITGQAVADLEAGGRITSVATCEALAHALGVSPAWLAYGADSLDS